MNVMKRARHDELKELKETNENEVVNEMAVMEPLSFFISHPFNALKLNGE